MSIAASLFCIVSLVGSVGGGISLLPSPRADIRLVTNSQSCPVNLSALRDEIEVHLASVSSEEFKTTIRESLNASIPEAIQQADGINSQIVFLRKEIAEQDQYRKDAEETARMSTNKPGSSLASCQPGEKGSYCSAVEQFYISSASNVANRGFLAALECYKRNGMR